MARLAKKAPSKTKPTSGASKPSSIGKKVQLSAAKTSSTGSAAANNLLTKELNEFLHQDKDTKKQKQAEKRSTFLTKIGADSSSATPNSLRPDSYKHTTITDLIKNKSITTIHDLPGKISKSGLRRQKRKAKAAVLTSVTDLGSALPDFSTPTTTASTSTAKSAYKSSTKNVATDRPPTSKMTERVVRHEMNKFNQTLNSEQFKASPFAALRASINATMVKKQEFVIADKNKSDSMEL